MIQWKNEGIDTIIFLFYVLDLHYICPHPMWHSTKGRHIFDATTRVYRSYAGQCP
jgi:hypothetical protein